MKNILVVTSTRADYGLLKPVLRQIAASDALNLTIVATGTHLLDAFGNTLCEIEGDGFFVKHKLNIMKFGNDDLAVAKTIAYTIDLFTTLFCEERPDMLLLLGDRYEIFSVATAASAVGVPIAHISGGDVTEGAKDDFYRHCIAHMSSVHFPSCADSYNRLLRLGQDPSTVHNVGGLGDENIRTLELLSLTELEKSLEFDLSSPFALITYHPETQKTTSPADEVQKLLDALDKIDGLRFIFTKANADAGGESINSLIYAYCDKHPDRAKSFFSLGLRRYLSAMKYCCVVIGNSSSGVVETPTFKTPCVNIGDRQKGRFIARNILCTGTETDEILQGIKTALSSDFRTEADRAISPYNNGVIPSVEIVKHLAAFMYSGKNNIKTFYDGE